MTVSRERRRRFPRPEQPPEGYTTWDHPTKPGEVIYISEEEIRQLMEAAIDTYDEEPQAVRDFIKEHGHWP